MSEPALGFLAAFEQPVGAARPYLFAAHSPEEQLSALLALDEWVGWLVDRYNLDRRTIPPCWASHGELIEELSALRLAWLTAYAQMGPGDGPLGWHERFAHGRARLADWAARTGCAGAHRARAGGAG